MEMSSVVPLLWVSGLTTVAVGVLLLVRNHFQGGTFRGKERISGQTVIITGANGGLGKKTAIELAKRGGRIILACRDINRAQAAKDEICKLSGSRNVVVRKLNLSSRTSIIEFVKEFLKNEKQLDILINNAGVMMPPRTETEEGIEMQLGVNHMGHFLLTNLLLERLKESSPSRIVTVSSIGHRYSGGEMDFDDLNCEKSYSPQDAYHHSKLANVLFTKELARKLKGTGVTTYTLHPGLIATELSRHIQWTNNPIVRLFLGPLLWVFTKTTFQGAQTTLYCALALEIANDSGKYYADCRLKEPVVGANNEESARHLWTISEKWMKLTEALADVKTSQK